jgi:hypothetical protein
MPGGGEELLKRLRVLDTKEAGLRVQILYLIALPDWLL